MICCLKRPARKPVVQVPWLADLRLASESAIRWQASPTGLPYIRETLMLCRHRRGPVKIPGGRVLGWAELAPDRRFNGFVFRRVWWLKNGSDPYPGRWCPAEAVAPASIAPGVPSQRLYRQEVIHAG